MEQEMTHCAVVAIPGAGHAVPMHHLREFEAATREWLLARRLDNGNKNPGVTS